MVSSSTKKRDGSGLKKDDFSPKMANSASYIEVPEDREGQRLDNFLINRLKGVPKSLIYRIIRTGQVRVNKGRIKPDYRVKDGDQIRVPPLKMGTDEKAPPPSSKNSNWLLDHILYEDDYIVVLNKPSQIAVHGGSGLSFGVIEAMRVASPRFAKLELIHRLDKETSGCLMLAKKRSGLRVIHDLFQKGEIQKHYLALVKGKWSKEGIIETKLEKNQLKSGERIVKVAEDGKVSKSDFRIVEIFPKTPIGPLSLVKVLAITGRTHQIRVHALYAGHPIIGDPKYGDNDFNLAAKKLGLNRLFLHASQIQLQLPWKSTPLIVEAPLDDRLQDLLMQLREGV